MQQSDSETTPETVTQQPEAANMETGVIAEQILSGNEGDIHYSYYLPENYDENKAYPLMMTMPPGVTWSGAVFGYGQNCRRI